MKKKILHFLSISLVLGVIFMTTNSNYIGITGYSQSGCAGASGCHGGTANSSVNIVINGFPASYTNGTTYTITIGVYNTLSLTQAGFDLSVSGGTLSGAPTNTAIVGNELRHNLIPSALLSGAASWSFQWTAPATGSIPVTLSAAVNCVNANGQSSGDSWNKKDTTSSGPIIAGAPIIGSASVTNIGATSATINAQINPNGGLTNASVKYGTTSGNYAFTTSLSPGSLTGTTMQSTTVNLPTLSPSLTYYYIIEAVGATTVVNSEQSFTTLAAGINDLKKATLEIYPNPVIDFINIKSDKFKANAKVNIYNTIGALVLQENLNSKNGIASIDLAAITKGNYLIIIEENGIIYNQFFIKQ